MTLLLLPQRNGRKAALHRVLDAYAARIDYSRGIFLKPNIVFAVRPNSGEITPPSFVKDLIEVLRERRPRVDIVIGEGVAAGCDPRKNFEVSGYARMARTMNVPLLDLHRSERMQIGWTYGTLELPVTALERTYISLPLLKPSSACVISGALKNQKGLLLPSMKKQFHKWGLHEQVAQLNAVVKPELTIMDCHLFWGRPVILAGDNCGEIDASACRLLGIEEPEHVRLSKKAGVFLDGSTLSGDDPSRLRKAKGPVIKEFRQFGRLRLWSNPRACSMCRYLFQDLRRIPTKWSSLIAIFKFLKYALLGADVILGSQPFFVAGRRHVICVGECTKGIARDSGYIHIPGCPPTENDLINNISSKVGTDAD